MELWKRSKAHGRQEMCLTQSKLFSLAIVTTFGLCFLIIYLVFCFGNKWFINYIILSFCFWQQRYFQPDGDFPEEVQFFRRNGLLFLFYTFCCDKPNSVANNKQSQFGGEIKKNKQIQVAIFSLWKTLYFTLPTKKQALC